MNEWSKTVKPDGDGGLGHYAFDKTVSGLVDLQLYANHEPAGSAAMAYDVLGDASYLEILKNGYDYLQQTQVYATGYGPNERFMAPDGSLGRALDTRSDTAEVVCGSWAGFKMARYLMRFTGAARYGDWMERLFYNGVGAALPLRGRGRNFYYGDYGVGGGMKVYNWERPEGKVVVEQETQYPEAETSTLTIKPAKPARFAMKLHVPSWTRGMTVRINGAPASVECKPGTWAIVERTWNPGDRVDVTIPLTLRMEAVDRQHPIASR